jgi:hypothetical protein
MAPLQRVWSLWRRNAIRYRGVAEKYGYLATLRATATALFALTGPLIPLLKGRLPPTGQDALSGTDWAFFMRPLFWIYTVPNVIQGLGYFFPSLCLPS